MSAARWQHATGVLTVDVPRIVGVVNVTPDSFSDGGSFLDPEQALRQAALLAQEGADVLEVGGESTRPGAKPVEAEEEIRRVVPVVEAMRKELPEIPIAVDTVKSAVAEAALQAGASIINDVSGLRIDRRIGTLCAKHQAGLVLMHSRGDVADMASYQHANYGHDVMMDIAGELRGAVEKAEHAGVPRAQIVLDPGLGFSKRSEHSIGVVSQLERLVAMGFPVLVGASRKRFIGELSGVSDPKSRVSGTIAVNVLALAKGARLFRVHDVKANHEALSVAWAVLQSGQVA